MGAFGIRQMMERRMKYKYPYRDVLVTHEICQSLLCDISIIQTCEDKVRTTYDKRWMNAAKQSSPSLLVFFLLLFPQIITTITVYKEVETRCFQFPPPLDAACGSGNLEQFI